MSTASVKQSREEEYGEERETAEGGKTDGAMRWHVGANDRQRPGYTMTCHISSEISRGVFSSCGQSKDSTCKI